MGAPLGLKTLTFRLKIIYQNVKNLYWFYARFYKALSYFQDNGLKQKKKLHRFKKNFKL